MTRWPQRSRLQITLSDLTSSCIFQSLRACQRRIEDPNSLKLAGCNTDIGIYDLFISDLFLYRWPQVMSFSWPSHYRSMVKIEVPLIRIRFTQLTQNHNQIDYAWYPRRTVASFPFERLSEVTLWRHRVAVRFLPITCDRNELEMWSWCHSVCFVKAHRLTCNMTYLSPIVTLTWRDLRSNFKIYLSRIKTYGSIQLDERNTMVSIVVL